MKFIWPTLGLVLGLAAAVAGVTYYCMRASAPQLTSHDSDSLIWIRQEFQLSPAQMTRIETLHAAYHQVCDSHCEAIVTSRAKLRRLESEGITGPALMDAKAEARQIDLACRASLEAHVREIAEVIGGEQGHRYLATILPKIDHFNHEGPPDLQLNEQNANDGHGDE